VSVLSLTMGRARTRDGEAVLLVVSIEMVLDGRFITARSTR
jgi:hypothetical protein